MSNTTITREDRERIQHLRLSGVEIEAISSVMKVTPQQVKDICPYEPIERGIEDRNRIKKALEEGDRQTLREICTEYGVGVLDGVDALARSLRATKIIERYGKFYAVPDHKTQLQAAELSLRIHQVIKDKNDDTSEAPAIKIVMTRELAEQRNALVGKQVIDIKALEEENGESGTNYRSEPRQRTEDRGGAVSEERHRHRADDDSFGSDASERGSRRRGREDPKTSPAEDIESLF